LKVGKYQPSQGYQQAMFLGNGLSYAERLLKSPEPNPWLLAENPFVPKANFSGFECRWQEIESPHQEMVTLLVESQVAPAERQQEVYRQVIALIHEIYGPDNWHHPLREQRLKLALDSKALAAETRVQTAGKAPRQRYLYPLKLKLTILLGKVLLKFRGGSWALYKQKMIANTDYRKFDELLRMVIAGTAGQRLRLRAALAALHDQGVLAFGMHAAPKALVTCMIQDYHDQHVHFLDGADGGYTLAALEMKQQKKAMQLKKSPN
jgi:hypothetical protein